MSSQNAKNSIFLTGITGALGSWLAGEALAAGTQVVALVRAGSEAEARDRLSATFATVGIEHLSSTVGIALGDLGEPAITARLEGQIPDSVTTIVHCAASTQFQEDNAEESFLANVEGTRRILELAERKQLTLTHVSSAYVAGKRTGTVMEDELDEGQEFNNVYERTKFLSEVEVRDWAAKTGLPVTILRPGIVMGDSRTGRTVRFNGLYDFIRVVDLLIPHLNDQVLRVATDEHVTKNIIPVDYFARTAWHIISNNLRGCYHITNPTPPTMRELAEMLLEIYGPHKYDLVQPREFKARKPSSLEQLVLDATKTYHDYMLHEPVFDRTNTDRTLAGTHITFPPTDAAYFRRLLEYAHEVKWGKLHAKPKARRARGQWA